MDILYIRYIHDLKIDIQYIIDKIYDIHKQTKIANNDNIRILSYVVRYTKILNLHYSKTDYSLTL